MHTFAVHHQWRSTPWLCGLGLAVAVVCTTACSHTPTNTAGASETSTAPGVPAPQSQQVVGPDAGNDASVGGIVNFDADRAFRLLQAQCDFGPRPPLTEAHSKCRDFLMHQLQPLVDDFTVQNWSQPITAGPGAGRSYPMTNILGIIHGQGAPANDTPKLMLCAHWDTRPVADMDPIAANRKQPILGANDGASGVAVLLEVARVVKANRPAQTVLIALWDGEDLGQFFYGARRFAALSRTAAWKRWRPNNGILLDMIGDRDLRCNREVNSVRMAPDLYQQVMNTAADAGLAPYFNGPDMEVEDDHFPLNQAGIPTIDLIDFNYRPWHTLEDTPDKCSPASLKVIGTVLLRVCARLGQA